MHHLKEEGKLERKSECKDTFTRLKPFLETQPILTCPKEGLALYLPAAN